LVRELLNDESNSVSSSIGNLIELLLLELLVVVVDILSLTIERNCIRSDDENGLSPCVGMRTCRTLPNKGNKSVLPGSGSGH
jgi:hypothetical protein